jgi:Cu(I)/Ag(I) efflux system membrane fusion protein
MPNHIFKPYVAALLALGLFLGCGKGSDKKPQDTAPGMAGMEGMAGMAGAGDSGVALDRSAASRLGITFARASTQPMRSTIQLAGTLTYAEPRRAYVNARVSGWVEQLNADYVGKPVRAGDALLELYSPELVSAQDEYLAARRLGDSSLVAAARRRLSLWDIAEKDLDHLELTGTSRRTLTIRAPRSGEIVEKMITDGQAVQPGENLFLIADRSVLWADIALPEMDAEHLRVGTPVSLTVTAMPGRRYSGKVTFIQPALDERTRTLTARIEVANRDGQLRPGMYATGEVSTSGSATLTVPLEAVIPTGTRNLVFVNRGDGSFIPREVVVGARGDSLVEIRQGLKPGDEVVASATYLLDSETNLAAAMQGLMLRMGMGLNMGGMASPRADSQADGMGGMKMPSTAGDTTKRGLP